MPPHKLLQLILGITEDIYSLGLCQRSSKANFATCTYLGQLDLTSTILVTGKRDLVASTIVDERDTPCWDRKCRRDIKQRIDISCIGLFQLCQQTR